MPQVRMPVPVVLILTLAPAALIGATLWIAGGLVPACTIDEAARLTAPDGRFDLVTFSRDCGDTPPNTQAALIPAGDALPLDAASFFAAESAADLAPAWSDAGAIELSLPEGGTVLRQDTSVAGIAVTYR
jgi:hypothetical protein